MTVTPRHIIEHLRPGARSNIDYRLQDDGNGWYIATWSHNSVQPTAQEIAGVDLIALGRQIEATSIRNESFASDSERQELLARLHTATPVQIKNYVENNVTSLATAKTLLAKVLLVLSAPH
jgi:hypothetical protein